MSDLRDCFLFANSRLVHLYFRLSHLFLSEVEANLVLRVVDLAQELSFLHKVAFLGDHFVNDSFCLSGHGHVADGPQVSGSSYERRNLTDASSREFNGCRFLFVFLIFVFGRGGRLGGCGEWHPRWFGFPCPCPCCDDNNKSQTTVHPCSNTHRESPPRCSRFYEVSWNDWPQT